MRNEWQLQSHFIEEINNLPIIDQFSIHAGHIRPSDVRNDLEIVEPVEVRANERTKLLLIVETNLNQRAVPIPRVPSMPEGLCSAMVPRQVPRPHKAGS